MLFPTLETPWLIAIQALLSMGFPRQEYWNGLPFPSPGNLPDTGIEPVSPVLAGEFFTTVSLSPVVCVGVCVCTYLLLIIGIVGLILYIYIYIGFPS